MAEPNRSELPETRTYNWPMLVRDLAMRVMDRGQLHTIPLILASLALLVGAYRAPPNAYSKMADVAGAVVNSERWLVPALFFTNAVLLFACGTLLIVLRASWKLHRAEIERMAEQKRALERRLDPQRPNTYGEDTNAV